MRTGGGARSARARALPIAQEQHQRADHRAVVVAEDHARVAHGCQTLQALRTWVARDARAQSPGHEHASPCTLSSVSPPTPHAVLWCAIPLPSLAQYILREDSGRAIRTRSESITPELTARDCGHAQRRGLAALAAMI